MRVFLSLLAMVAVLAIGAFAALRWEEGNFGAPGPVPDEKIVIVEPGTSLRGIADRFEREGIVKSAFLFRIGVMRRGRSSALQAGEYAVPPRISMADIMALLMSGKVVEHRITIPEGVTSMMALDIVKADPVLTGEVSEAPPEGSLLPETYLFRRGTTRLEMLARMRKAQGDLLAALWAKRKSDLPFSTPEEAIILASIVEKETGLPAERPRIAAIFVNRLKRGMKLESDPTIIYGLTGGVPLGHPLRQSELAKENSYSTYQIQGLPPTPIANPGKDAIAAVLNPPDSEELFFVADGSGGHAFAKTLAEHTRNVARLRRLEREALPGR
jgi:UPF0755 protein